MHGVMPWASVNNGGAGCNGGVAPAATRVSDVTGPLGFNTGTMPARCLDQLVAEGELKATFPVQYAILNKLWITDTTPVGSTATSVAICFDPESKSESTRPETKYNKNPTDVTVCDPATPNNTCYWCAQ